jgi:putative ABC transport system permease protein
MLSSMRQDFHHSLRLMRRAPGFTAAALVTLALAIGANTAVFSVVYGVLLRQLPYPNADRIVRLSEEHPGGRSIVRQAMLGDLTFDAWRPTAATIDTLSVYSSTVHTVTGLGEPIRVEAASVSPSLFSLVGALPTRGRLFTPEETTTGANRVAIIGDGMWRNTFGADPAIVGRALTLDGVVHEIVGVLPPGFYFPDRDAALWTPYVAAPPSKDGMRVIFALARLKPGITPEQAAAEGTAAARSVKRPMAAELLFGKGAPVEVRVRRLADEMTRSVRPAMQVLMVAVALVLLIACANVANLLLARGVSRGREIAVRAALGAGGGRLARQLLTESVTLSLTGGAIGVLIAWLLTRAAPAWAPEGFPRLDDVRLDWRVIAFALTASLASGAVAGLFPVWRAVRAPLTASLRSDDARSVGAGTRVRSGLLVVEAALSVMLLIGAALLARSFDALVNVNPGYETSGVLTARIYLSGAASTPERRAQIVDGVVQRLRSAPQVAAVGAGNMAPLGESSYVSGFAFGTNAAGERVVARALQYVVTDGYAEALGLRVKEGRSFQPSDAAAPVQAMLVNESFARTYMNDGKPVIGRRYRGLVSADTVTTEIVGVLGDVLKDGLDTTAQSEIYLPHGKNTAIRREVNVVLRARQDPAALVPLLRSIVTEVEPTAAVDRIATLDSQLERSVAEPRLATSLLAGFAAIALALAVTGLYGVLSYTVSQRRREIGIRSALGASRGSLVRLVLSQGLAVTIAGLVVGVAASALAARALRPMLFGIEPLDRVSFIVMPLVLFTVALLACIVPARRAAAMDPAATLKAE